MTTEHEFTTIAVSDLIDGLCAAVDAARVAAEGNTRWLNAINAAWDRLLTVEAVEYCHDDHALIYHSESGKTYTANGRCQCEAFRASTACAHRAAARLVFRALEWNASRELDALAAELVEEAQAAGCAWYDADIAAIGATARMPELADFAAQWDAEALERRIGAAQSAAMARAA